MHSLGSQDIFKLAVPSGIIGRFCCLKEGFFLQISASLKTPGLPEWKHLKLLSRRDSVNHIVIRVVYWLESGDMIHIKMQGLRRPETLAVLLSLTLNFTFGHSSQGHRRSGYSLTLLDLGELAKIHLGAR